MINLPPFLCLMYEKEYFHGVSWRRLGHAHLLAAWSRAVDRFAPRVPVKGSVHGLTGSPVSGTRRELPHFA